MARQHARSPPTPCGLRTRGRDAADATGSAAAGELEARAQRACKGIFLFGGVGRRDRLHNAKRETDSAERLPTCYGSAAEGGARYCIWIVFAISVWGEAFVGRAMC